MTKATKCPVCHHESHKPGKCKRDNCGESDLVNPTSPLTPRDLTVEPRRGAFSSAVSTERYGYNKGRRVKKKKTDNG